MAAQKLKLSFSQEVLMQYPQIVHGLGGPAQLASKLKQSRCYMT